MSHLSPYHMVGEIIIGILSGSWDALGLRKQVPIYYNYFSLMGNGKFIGCVFNHDIITMR